MNWYKMNWYKKIIESQEWSVDKKRRMPESDQQLYDYFNSDDPPFRKEDYIDYKMRDIDLVKPPDEMDRSERGAILHPDDGDIGKSDHKIDKVVDSIIEREGEISEKILQKYLLEFMPLNLPLKYIGNYIRKNYELV